MFALVDVHREVLGDEAVEEHAEHVGLEVPAVHTSAQVVRDAPDGLV